MVWLSFPAGETVQFAEGVGGMGEEAQMGTPGKEAVVVPREGAAESLAGYADFFAK